MKILGLYNNACALELFQWLSEKGHEVVLMTDRLDRDWCIKEQFNLAVSYTYRYILTAELLEALENNVVNIHNSFLPYNRGANPNLWSIIEGTPRGVSIHYMDKKLDKGCIIAQTMVNDTDEETLASSYNNLDCAAKKLFMDVFKYYEFWPQMKKQIMGTGTYHSIKDTQAIVSMIKTYDISISEFRKLLKNTKEGVYWTSKVIRYSGNCCQVMAA